MTGLETPLAKTVGTVVARKFGTKVVERWTRHRAARFFDGFIESVSTELKTGVESTSVDNALQEILDDDIKSELLFDAYRTVCLSKSKTLGPKMVGLLVGRLVVEGRTADDNDEQIFRAAESLSDIDLIELFKEFRKRADAADVCQNPQKDAHWIGEAIVVPWSEEVRDSTWPHSREAEIDTTPLNFEEVFGSWGRGVARLGLLTGRATEREVEYKEDSECHIDQDGILRTYSWTLTFEAPCRQLCELLARCLGSSTKPNDNGI